MGKHKTKKSRQHRRQQGSTQSSQPGAAVVSGPPLIQRIQHADPQTRLAALTGLLQQQLQQEASRPSIAVAQAVCAQVVVPTKASATQLSIATTAATLMATWATQHSEAQSDADDQATAGWPLVLQGQLQTCWKVWQQQTTKEASSSAFLLPQWGECARQCLYAWTSLIESNPCVMDRLLQSEAARREALGLLRDWMQVTTSTDSGSTVSDASHPLHLPHSLLAQGLAETTARALHSLVQDNPALVEPWWDELATDERTWWTSHLTSILQPPSSTASSSSSSGDAAAATTMVVTRLHVAGVWMACRNILADEGSWQAPSVLACVVQTWTDALRLPWVATNAPSRVVEWQEAYNKAAAQTEDNTLERLVLRQQSQKRESARSIARRLAAQNSNNDSTPMMEDEEGDDDNLKSTTRSGHFPAERPDHVQTWEDMLDDWEITVRPLELALEIIAHWTAVGPEDAVRMEDDDEGYGRQAAVWDDQLSAHFEELPGGLWTCFTGLHQASWMDLPPHMAGRWSEIQSKASTGLGHCIVQVARSTGLEGITPSILWTVLWEALRHTQVASIGRQAVLALVVMVLQAMPALRQQASATELDLLLSLLSPSSTKESQAVIREAVVVLGVLCSEAHSAKVNAQVCAALLATASDDNPLVRAEVLNVLMDIYGDDDCHPAVFTKLEVLRHFEESVPELEQQLSQVDRRTIDPNDLDHWKETALNGARFLEYKHDQL
jgi:hypothetical protein